MAASNRSDTLLDPVCAQPVDASVPYRQIHGGAVFCFCSERCRDLFIADPERYVVLVNAVLRGGRRTRADVGPDPDSVLPVAEGLGLVKPARVGRPPAIDGQHLPPEPTVRTTLQLMTIPVWPEQAGLGELPRSPGAAPGPLPGRGWRDVVAGLFPWRERRFARQVSRELLQLYGSVKAQNPGLQARDLYRRIVIARTRGDELSAETLLDQAEESFAEWPTRRALKFNDVVHFIAVSEFLASHGNSPWIYANMGREVASHIPAEL
jgi:YHS domain-containing protein